MRACGGGLLVPIRAFTQHPIPIIFSVLIDTPAGSVMAFGERFWLTDWSRHLKCLFRLTSVSVDRDMQIVHTKCMRHVQMAPKGLRVDAQTDEGLAAHIYAMEMEYSRPVEAATCTPACRPAAVDKHRSRPETPSSRPTSVRATCRRTLRATHNWHLVR
jgi:hypothetical protein